MGCYMVFKTSQPLLDFAYALIRANESSAGPETSARCNPIPGCDNYEPSTDSKTESEPEPKTTTETQFLLQTIVLIGARFHHGEISYASAIHAFADATNMDKKDRQYLIDLENY